MQAFHLDTISSKALKRNFFVLKPEIHYWVSFLDQICPFSSNNFTDKLSNTDWPGTLLPCYIPWQEICHSFTFINHNSDSGSPPSPCCQRVFGMAGIGLCGPVAATGDGSRDSIWVQDPALPSDVLLVVIDLVALLLSEMHLLPTPLL